MTNELDESTDGKNRTACNEEAYELQSVPLDVLGSKHVGLMISLHNSGTWFSGEMASMLRITPQ